MKKLSQPKLSDWFKSQESNNLLDPIDERCSVNDVQYVPDNARKDSSCATSSRTAEILIQEPTVNFTVPPSDISPKNSFDRTTTITYLKNFVFPKTKIGRANRCFQLGWLENYKWLEYSISRNSAFCFACRHFGVRTNIDPTFTVTGYSNWKKALEKDKGFLKHEASVTHKNAILTWNERDKMKTTVTETLTGSILEKRRYYMTAVVECIIFLVENEVSLRGCWDSKNHAEDGIFRNIFEFQLKHDEELRKCQSVLPKNATYLSPDIQNEMISILTQMVREEIVDEIKSADVDHFTIYVDGTKTRTNKECMSLATRYVFNGSPIESLLQLYGTDKFDAKTNANLILQTIKDCGLNTMFILSQCCDGANVMSGDNGGIQRIIQQILGRVIPYVHCCNLRLHLCVIAAIEKVSMVKLFFENIKLIYNFFRRPKIQTLYEGSSILSLIATRWSGHNRSTIAVHDNYDELIKTLPKVNAKSSLKFDGDDIALAIGILSVIKDIKFVFMLVYMKEFLNLISPADKILQSRDVGYREAMPVINAVVSEVRKLRTTASFDRIWNCSQEILSKHGIDFSNDSKPTRTRKIPSNLNFFFITDSIGERNSDVKLEIMSAYFEVIDIFMSEMKDRFEENSDILLAISDANELSIEKLQPMKSFGLTLPPEAELLVAKAKRRLQLY